jgi:hypothetical protein
VWPLDRNAGHEYLRVGPHAVERWKDARGALSLEASQALQPDAVAQAQVLVAAVRALYSNKPEKKVTLLLESAWLPVMLVDTGSTPLSSVQFDALVRHRFGLHYGDMRDPVSAWELRIEHQAGRRHALAYGLSPRIKQALIEAGEASGVKWDAMLPAIGWGRQRLRPAAPRASATAWWAWQEQDRLLVARTARNEIVGFNSGAARFDDETGIVHLIESEEARLGVATKTDPITVAVWDDPARARPRGERLLWQDVRGPVSQTASAFAPSRVQALA